jgi:hypothetical protein
MATGTHDKTQKEGGFGLRRIHRRFCFFSLAWPRLTAIGAAGRRYPPFGIGAGGRRAIGPGNAAR